MTAVAILGCSGRMGRALIEALAEREDLTLTGALSSPRSGAVGTLIKAPRSGGSDVRVTDDRAVALSGADVAIDFTLPEAVAANISACVGQRVALVLGTTALEAATLELLRGASSSIAVLQSPNMSVGVNVLLDLVARAARALGPDYEVDIFDLHHQHKKDAPSGTALKLGERVAGALGRSFDAAAAREQLTRDAPRNAQEIRFAAAREGDHVGEHTVSFRAAGEEVTLMHRATDRLTFARGALNAARWLASQSPGQYSMSDVIASGTAGE